MLALLFLEQGKSDKALKLLKAVLLYDPDNLYALKLTCRANFESSHFDDAIDAGLRYIELTRPSQPVMKLAEATSVTEEDQSGFSYPTPLCMILSRAYWAKGQEEESRKWARYVKESNLESGS